MGSEATKLDPEQKYSKAELFEKLETRASGLTGDEVRQRQDQYGYNEIIEQRAHPLLKFLHYFWGPIPWMIEVAAILSAVVHHWEDFWIIFALLLLNAVVGFWQEHKADNAIELLKQRLALKARVRRDGQWGQCPARDLVPGDIIRLRLGDIVPADARIVEGDYVLTDESALTGESMPVEKHELEGVYSGSVVRQGEVDGLVTATGMSTFFGRTAQLVAEARTRSHFQRAVIKIGDYLIVLALALVILIFLIALFRQESFLDTLEFALILTVAAIPAALPAVLSVTMAVGATNLARKEAIVSKLVAIEEMAGMDVLCSDKTGTITMNELTVGRVIPVEGFSETEVLALAVLASRREDEDPIDNAIIDHAAHIEEVTRQVAECEVVAFSPFDPVSKRTGATIRDAGRTFKASKGAPQVILALGTEDDALGQWIAEQVNELAGTGYRALGVARSDGENAWRYAGLIALYDPPREDSAATIETAQSMNVDVRMVTGDHVAIAREIARQVHLGDNIREAKEFLDKDDSEAGRIMEQVDGFAQVFPEHKYRIVELLQERDHIVGMTGDGVNDAPALKKADVGIAVAGSTDAAKSAADIVLTRSGLSVIIDAIKESRKIFQRMNSYAIYRIAETIRVLLFITLSIIVFNFYPVTAVMIVLLALLNDAPIMAIAYDRVRYANHPERWNMRIVLGMATFLGILGVVFSFLIFYVGRVILHLNLEVLQSFIFLKLAVAGHLTIFVARTRGPFWSIRPAGALFWSAVGTKVLATLVVVYGWYMAPIGWELALLVWGYALVAFLITDAIKIGLYRLLDHTGLIFSRVPGHHVRQT